MPREGLLCSVLIHALAMLLVWFIGSFPVVKYQSRSLITRTIDLSDSHELVYLPELGGGTEGGGRAGGGVGSGLKSPPALPARSSKGFAYPGAQPIVSNPPNATAGIQTILQPSVDKLPRLRTFLELPNIVQPPAPATSPEPKQLPMIVKGGRLSITPLPEKPLAAPKVTLPVSSSSNIADVMEARPQMPKAAPEPVEAPNSTIGTRQQGLLVLNAVPPPPDVRASVPRAEARSVFAISPAEVTTIAAPSAGTNAGGSPLTAAGTGGATGLATGDALASTSSAGNSTHPHPGESGAGSGGRVGDGEGRGMNSASSSAGSGRGTASGPAVGTGSANGHGTGTGAGSAPGAGGFPGITIQGGRYGNSANMVVNVGPRRAKSYGMSIESTAGSGGGLPDLGVFRNEKVYTVYLDMRSNDEDHVPSWTLQYAVLRGQDNPAAEGSLAATAPTPPYATLKEIPQFTPAVARTGARGLIVAAAILGTDGKLQEVSVKQTPESQVIAPLVQALSDWVFEPAKIDGHPVALKILLGIRLPVSQ